jgi:hypothetical protein
MPPPRAPPRQARAGACCLGARGEKPAPAARQSVLNTPDGTPYEDLESCPLIGRVRQFHEFEMGNDVGSVNEVTLLLHSHQGL